MSETARPSGGVTRPALRRIASSIVRGMLPAPSGAVDVGPNAVSAGSTQTFQMLGAGLAGAWTAQVYPSPGLPPPTAIGAVTVTAGGPGEADLLEVDVTADPAPPSPPAEYILMFTRSDGAAIAKYFVVIP